MILSLIAAVAQNGVIGSNNQLPWHLPAELRHFRELTMGHPIIMGRKTSDAIGRALPGRRNIVVTQNRNYTKGEVEIVHSLDQALGLCDGEAEVFVIGGAEIYRQAIARADRIYFTRVHLRVDGDAFFPEIDFDQWKEVERASHSADAQNAHAYDFIAYSRK